MTYFSRRNNLVTEYSGHDEASVPLRNRILNIVNRYVFILGSQEFEYKLGHIRGTGDWGLVISTKEYDWVFDAVEIFLELALNNEYDRSGIVLDMAEAFSLSGSVYGVNGKGQIELRIKKELAKSLKTAEGFLSPYDKAFKLFYESAGRLAGRKDSPKNIIKDVFIAFEEYIKKITGKNDYGKGVVDIQNSGLISKTQKQVLDKIYAYRSDTFGVGHAGNSEEPKEIDALWFIETVVAQINFIGRKMEKNEGGENE